MGAQEKAPDVSPYCTPPAPDLEAYADAMELPVVWLLWEDFDGHNPNMVGVYATEEAAQLALAALGGGAVDAWVERREATA